MNTYLIQFYTSDQGNGYAIVNACNSKQASTILLSLGANIDDGYKITSILEYPVSFGLDFTVVLEGITTHGLSAYEIAVSNGFDGSVEEWLESLSLPAKDAALKTSNIILLALSSLTNITSTLELANSKILNIDTKLQEANTIKLELEQVVLNTNTINQLSLLVLLSINSTKDIIDNKLSSLETLQTQFLGLYNTVLEQESQRLIAELSRLDNEQTRQYQEGIRVTNENQRLEKEANRTTAELLRIINESTRVANETLRDSAETSRRNTASLDHTTAVDDHYIAVDDHNKITNTSAEAKQTLDEAKDATDKAIDAVREVDLFLKSGDFINNMDWIINDKGHLILNSLDTTYQEGYYSQHIAYLQQLIDMITGKIDNTPGDIDTIKELADFHKDITPGTMFKSELKQEVKNQISEESANNIITGIDMDGTEYDDLFSDGDIIIEDTDNSQSYDDLFNE